MRRHLFIIPLALLVQSVWAEPPSPEGPQDISARLREARGKLEAMREARESRKEAAPRKKARKRGRWVDAAAAVEKASKGTVEKGDSGEVTLEDMLKRLEKVEEYVVRRSKVHYIRRAPKDAWDLRFGGRVFNDWAVPSADGPLEAALGDFETVSRFRKARLVLKGFSDPNLSFKFELDFADGDADLTDVHLTLPGKGESKVRVGRHKEAFGLENVGSSRFLVFMERASVCETLMPKRNTGFSAWMSRPAPHPGYWLGYFRNAHSHGVTEDLGGHNVTARWTCQPRYVDGGRRLLHLGAAYSHRDAGHGGFRFRPKSGAQLVPAFGDTGELDAGSADVFGFQAAVVDGPFWAATEAARSELDLRDGRSGSLWGAYVAASYILTGEHRPFEAARRTFGRIVPRRRWDGHGGGAWEVALRYSLLDLIDSEVGIDGGDLREWTFAVNFYIHQNARIHFNYVRPDLEDIGKASICQMRFQIDF